MSGIICARGADGWENNILSFTWENDAVAMTDRHYTQGARVAWWSADDRLPGFMNWLSRHTPAIGMDVQARKWGLAFSQEIYTPEDLQNPHLIPEDRPYAGWLYASIGLQRRGRAVFDWPAMETFRLDLGVVGPESLADDTQKTWHGVEPRGWNNQLRTEIGAVLSYDRRYLISWRFPTESAWRLDFVPHFGAAAGNVSTYLAAGPLFRFGYHVPDEFAPAEPNSPPPRFGAYVFGGLDGRFVIRNIFLDGNTFVHSHHVEKIPLVGEAKMGLTVVLKKVEVKAGYTWLTREFERQNLEDSYGSATVTFKF